MQYVIVFGVGFVLGFLQSLFCGVKIGSWDSGTGCLWGLIIGTASSLSVLVAGWGGMAVALVAAFGVAGATLISAKRSSQEK